MVLLAGIAMPFSFAPYSMWFLPFFALAALYWSVQNVPLKLAWKLGLVFGLGYFAFGVYWIYHSVRLFGDAPAVLAVAMTALFVLVMALFPACVCAVYATLRVRGSWVLSNALLFSGLWLFAELLRGFIFGGFPWLLVGYSQIDTFFSGYAPVFGVFSISWLVVFMAAAGCELVAQRQWINRTLIATCVAIVVVTGIALATKIWTADQQQSLQMRLVQGNIKQELKFSRRRLEESLKMYQDLTLRAPPETQLVVWPETAIPTLFANVDARLRPFVEEMSARGTDVISGGFYRDENDKAYNSVRQLGGDRALYSKGHLVPFGEFMPFRTLLQPIARFVQIPMSDLSAAPAPARALAVADWDIGISICYEDVFGTEMRSTLPDAQLLINVSNDAWFGDSSAPHQHQEMARMRAREFERAMVRVTNTGITSVIDYRGQIHDSIAFGVQGTIDASIPLRTEATPYVSLGDLPMWILSGVTLILGVVFRFMHRPRAC